jgi:hypothetical protein
MNKMLINFIGVGGQKVSIWGEQSGRGLPQKKIFLHQIF